MVKRGSDDACQRSTFRRDADALSNQSCERLETGFDAFQARPERVGAGTIVAAQIFQIEREVTHQCLDRARMQLIVCGHLVAARSGKNRLRYALLVGGRCRGVLDVSAPKREMEDAPSPIRVWQLSAV